MYPVDIFVQNYLSLIRTPFLTESMYIVTSLFDPSVHVVSMSLFLALLIYLVRNFRYSLFFLVALASGWFLVNGLKIIFNVTRPTEGLISVLGQSFPSGHATIATIFFVSLMYIFDKYLENPVRALFNLCCVTSIFLVAFSRIYLGVHWLSDVIFGIIIGSVWMYILIKLFKRFIFPSVPNKS